MKKDKRVFKGLVPKDVNDENSELVEKEFAVIRPTLSLLQEANKLRSKLFNQLFEEGTLLRRQVDTELQNRDLWNEKLQLQYDSLQAEVIGLTQTLDAGGIKLSEARSIAIEIANKRQQLVEMLVSRSDLDNMTCEGQADNERFNFLFANCLVYNDTGEKVYPNGLEDYLNDADNEVAVKGATEFYYLISNSESLDNKLPENQFLKKYKFVDDDNNFIERGTGRRVSEEGKYIDENGYFISYNDDGTTYRVNANGEPIVIGEVESLPFLDDDGNPLDDEGNPVAEEEPKKKTTRKRRTTKKAETVETVDADA